MRNLIVLTIFATTAFGIWDETRYHDKNDWYLRLSNFGVFARGGWGQCPPGHVMVYGGGVWVGGIRPNGDTVVSVGYCPQKGLGELVPGLLPNEPGYTDTTEHLYLSTEPHFPVSPRSEQDGWCVFNDFDTMRHWIDSIPVRRSRRPLGVSILQRTYTWTFGNASRVVFFEYAIVNDTNYAIRQFYSSIAIDPDIEGQATDDLYGLDLARRMGFVYDRSGNPNACFCAVKLLSPQRFSSFKAFNIAFDPAADTARYLTMAGYDYRNGQYLPFDSICPGNSDQRFVISAGPNDLAPRESLKVCWALIATTDSLDMRRKADWAQWYYDHQFPAHQVTVVVPNGGEYISEYQWLKWRAQSGSGLPVLIDVLLSPDLGRSWETLFVSLPNTDSVRWNTLSHTDGSGLLLKVTARDSLLVTSDVSDSSFSINNWPGQGRPFVRLFSPSGESLGSIYKIRWFARDPELRDSLLINIYLKSSVGGWQALALNEPNDREYDWDSRRYQNGKSWVKITTYDGTFTSADSCSCYVYNRISGGGVIRRQGIDSLTALHMYIHHPEQITSHTYLLAFDKPGFFIENDVMPDYIYSIIDSNTTDTVLNHHHLSLNGYQWDTVSRHRFRMKDFSPIIDGFSIETRSHDWVTPSYFAFDTALVLSGVYPESLLRAEHTTSSYGRWAFRGSNYRVRWIRTASGALSIDILDQDYSIPIPYKPFREYELASVDKGDGWCFSTVRFKEPSDTLVLNYHTRLYVCGAYLYLNQFMPITIPPGVGDSWRIISRPIRPPVDGNVYRFRPLVSIEELAALTKSLFLAPNRPNPFSRTTLISYAIPTKARVKLIVYDVTGRKVKTICNRALPSGIHSFVWCGDDDRKRPLASGVYFLRMEALEKQFNRKIVLVR